ncbi:MAG TPA: shikimate kinase [Caulobacteraceae bacterium]
MEGLPNNASVTAPPSTRTIALVGLMGVGKSTIGRRLAQALELPFRDADQEIELAAGRTIPEIFAERGEAEFRAGERRVIGRMLQEPPHVLATGGGAFMDDHTRTLMKEKAITVWLKADLDVLVRRVGRKTTRPLLIGKDPRQVLQALMQTRYPVYAEADITIETDDRPASAAVNAILGALGRRVEPAEV